LLSFSGWWLWWPPAAPSLGFASDPSGGGLYSLLRSVVIEREERKALCCYLMSHRTRWETPRGRYDEHNSMFSLSMKPKFNRPIGERTHFWRLLLVGARRQLMARCRCQLQRGTCTQHNQTTLPQLIVRFQQIKAKIES
jgi:hypothetical protein